MSVESVTFWWGFKLESSRFLLLTYDSLTSRLTEVAEAGYAFRSELAFTKTFNDNRGRR